MKKSMLKVWIKISILIFIFIIIFSMWWVKNHWNTSKHSTDVVQSSHSQEYYNNIHFNLNAREKNEIAILFEYGLPIIVDYGADSCMQCQQMAPVLKRLNENLRGKAFIKFVDVKKYREAIGDVPIRMIPSQVFWNANGTPFMPNQALKKRIPFDIHIDKETGIHQFTIHQGGLTEAQMWEILQEMGVTNHGNLAN